MKLVLYLILITFVPGIELRGSIPYGMIIDKQMHWLWVAILCTVANIGVGFATFYLIEYVTKAMQIIPWVHRLWTRYIERTQKNIHASVEKYGEWGLAIFIGIPLPGTGAYTGALAANLIGMSHKRFAIANIAGVLMAGIIVTAFCYFGAGTMGWLFDLFVGKPKAG
jgi:uncharacterized membrane protein